MLNPQILEHCREQKREEREELFIQRYEGLLAWALRLTDHHRASAEDLVQDAFIQFVLGRTSIEEIENLDGYLRRMLRYMHLSRISRNSVQERTLSIIDYDSFNQGWRTLEPSRHLQAKEELFKICGYACARKETSRAGVVLILRFFHEYYPSEIARVLACSPHCVAQWQRVARNELKAFLNGQGGLRLFRAKTPKLVIPKLSALNGDLMAELRQMIFRSCQGACLPAEQLREIYKSGNEESLSVTRLAHIVSCPKCLDVVNRLLDLPPLVDRCDEARKGSGEPPHDNNGNGFSGGGAPDLRIRCQKRLREVVEHKPQELRIAVNSTPVSSLKVNSDLNELSLNIAEEETIEFVEVLSEQNLQLLFFSVGDASSGTDQWSMIELSEGRTLEVSLQLGTTLRMVYREPALADAPEPLALVKQDVSSSISVTPSDAVPVRQALHQQDEDNPPSALGRLWKLLRSKIVSNSDLTELTLLGRVSSYVRRPLWAHPGFVTVVLSIVAIGTYLLLPTSVAPPLTATLLLEQANQAEELIAGTPNIVVHRVISLEERDSAGSLISRRKIEVWANSEGNFAQRLYDETNRILAGTWEKPDGSRTVYHHKSGSRLDRLPLKTESLLLNLEDVWQIKLSAKEFRTLVSPTDQGRVLEQPSSYVVTYNEKTIGASRLLRATLTLSRTDLHAIEQTLLIERGNKVREYRFIEASFERLIQKDVPARVFEPDSVLERPVSRTATRSDATNSPFVRHDSSFPSMASAELEVDVAYLLNQAKADRNEQMSLSRTADGLLLVEGVVDTEQRRNDFLRALSPVSNNPLVKIEIATITKALQRQQSKSSSSVSIRDVEETVNTIAVDRELRNYFSGMTKTSEMGADLDEAVRSFSSRTVNRAYSALFHAIELKRLINRFAKVDMRSITPDARVKWLQMVREHAAAFERETVTLRHELQPLFSSSISSVPTAGEAEIGDEADLAQAVERIHKLAFANNEAIRSAFTISSQSSSAAIKSLQFWRALFTAGALAARIKQYNG